MVRRKRMQRVPKGGIPALILSGGRLKRFGDAKEYRVWVHPKTGDDFYFVFPSPMAALHDAVKLAASGKYTKVERPLAVVWDSSKGDWREVQIPSALYSETVKQSLDILS